jgi:Coenzyme PQQ synthesis protein D (PqqD)
MKGAPPDSDMHPERALGLKDDCLMWREIEDEVIVLDKRTWTYMGINGSGALLFKEIAESTTLGSLVARLKEHFGISESIAQRDVEAFVVMMESHELLAEDG